MNRTFHIFVFLFLFTSTLAFAKGAKKNVLTLTNGQYEEFFDTDSIEQIGSVLLNTNTKKIVGFTETSNEINTAVSPDLISRWLSLDPLASKYPSISPNVFVGNNPIKFVDPDGRRIIEAGNFIGSVYQPIFRVVRFLPAMQNFTMQFENSDSRHLYVEYASTIGYKTGQTNSEATGSKLLFSSSFNEYLDHNSMALTNIAMAQTSIHELIHGYIQNQLKDKKIDKEGMVLFYKDPEQHNYIAENFRGDIQSALTEYSAKMKFGLEESELSDLSWVGLTETVKFNKTFNSKEKVDDFNKRVGEIYYKLKSNDSDKESKSQNKNSNDECTE